MSVSSDILATYRGPGAVMRRRLEGGTREDRALAFLMAGCVLMFVARWPVLARESYLQNTDLQMELGGTLLGVVFILPLILYGLAFVGQLVMRALGRPVGAYPARLALFWALLASTPLALLHGLTGGFVGPGPARDIVGVLWCVAFLWFWVSGLRAAAEEKPA